MLAWTALAAAQAQADFGFAMAPTVSLSTHQAGAHPDLTTSFEISRVSQYGLSGSLKDATVTLPPGVIGNPTGIQHCTYEQLHEWACPLGSEVGELTVNFVFDYGSFGFEFAQSYPIWNLVPRRGVPAEFAAIVVGMDQYFQARARTDGEYAIETGLHDTQAVFPVGASAVTFWGVPADHNGSGQVRVPFLTNSADCEGANPAFVNINSWQHPETLVSAEVPLGPMTGCEDLPPLNASLTAGPTNRAAGQPTGYDIGLSVKNVATPDAPSTPPVQDVSVQLPPGTAISPSSANGLAACSPAQFGLREASAPSCPDASKVGAVTIDTPLLEHPLSGWVYLASPSENPFGTMLALYVVAEGSGVTVKLAGKVEADPVTGRLTATFSHNPQLPFNEFHMELFGGPRAPLVNAAQCGVYQTQAVVTPWGGGAAETPSSSFTISQDGAGAACAPQGFAPGFVAGTASPVAGGFSPFSLRLARSDGESQIGALSSVALPPGLLADVGSVPVRCTIAQANAAACPTESRIGTVTIGAGPGPDPFYVSGNAYLTDSYGGAPFGLAFVVHALAGPFDLGTVVVHAALSIDPHTAQATVRSDALPAILQGIPLQIRDVRVAIDRPGFTVNPTSCAAMSVNGTATSTQGATAPLQSRFQAGECAALAFKPSFSVHTAARTSRSQGASLHVTVKSGPGQANLGYVKVTLPRQLPSRLTTLHQACADTVFEADPANCPAASRIGFAKASTPLLASQLSGPAYFVSHGGAAFPDLVVVLQGEGVTVQLVGRTQIANNVTSTTFGAVPDVPVRRFDLTLPQGPSSVLSALGSLCKQRGKLAMPTIAKGQNGAVMQRRVKIAVDGCPRGGHPRHKQRK